MRPFRDSMDLVLGEWVMQSSTVTSSQQHALNFFDAQKSTAQPSNPASLAAKIHSEN